MIQLREKAYNLKEFREKKYQQFVEEFNDRQQQEACDDTQILRYRSITVTCINDRKYFEERKNMKENNTNKIPIPDEKEEIMNNMNAFK